MALPVLAAGALWAAVLGFVRKIIPTITRDVMKALGIGFVSFAGFELIWSGVQSLVYSRYNGLPTTALQLMDLAGADSALGMIFATFAGIVAYKAFSNATRIGWMKDYIT